MPQSYEVPEEQLKLHEQLKETIRELYGEEAHFVTIVPTHGIMVTSMEVNGMLAALSSVLSSILNNSYRATITEDDDGEPNRVGMN